MTTVTVTEQRVGVRVAESVVTLAIAPVSVEVGVAPGATSLLGLSDTPDTYGGQSLKVARVNAGETAIEFVAASGGGVTDHGALTGLSDDDHAQYHTDARGDLRYVPLARTLTINGTAFDLSANRSWTIAGGGVTSVDIIAPATGITAAGGPIISSGAITLALANDLAALEGLASTGIAVRSAADTWVQRALAGTTSRIDVTNGNGVSGNPTLDISSSYVGQSSITTLGTIGTGAWQGTAIGLGFGGTGAALTDPNADRILFWDDSAGAMAWLTLGTNLTITGTTLDATGGSGTIDGSGTAGRVASWTDSDTLQAANLIAPANLLTLVAAGAYTLTIPATGTAALLATQNVFSVNQYVGNTSTPNHRLGVVDNGYSGLYVVGIHTDDNAPWAVGIYNDTYSTTVPILEYYGDNNGTFYQGTHDEKDFRIYTNGLSNTRLLIGSDGNITVGSSAIAHRLAVKDGGYVGSFVFGVHADDDTPWLAGFFNDTYSTSVPTFEYFGENGGNFRMGTPAAKTVSIYTNGYTNKRMTIDDGGAVATQTGMMLWDVDNGALERVTVGAADSGGVGFKVLRIPN